MEIEAALELAKRMSTRAVIRRQIPGRASVELGQPDRIADILEEGYTTIVSLCDRIRDLQEKDASFKETS